MNTIILPAKNSNIEFTGERFVPGVTGEMELEHIHRYLFAVNACRDKRVLDIASGEGFGSFILAQCAQKVTGVDVDEEVVNNANNIYGSSHLKFLVGSCQKIPLADATVDVVVSFETLEHILEHDDFLKEIKRVLCPDGILIMSTPDTNIYSNGQPTENPYHLKELTLAEYESLIKIYFKNAHIFGQKCFAGCAIQNIDHFFSQNPSKQYSNIYFNPDADGAKMNYSLERIPYIVAVASDIQIEDKFLSNNFFVSTTHVNQLLDMRRQMEEDEKKRASELSDMRRQMEEDEKKLIEQSTHIDQLLETRGQMEENEKKRMSELSGMRKQMEEDEKRRVSELSGMRRQMEEDEKRKMSELSGMRKQVEEDEKKRVSELSGMRRQMEEDEKKRMSELSDIHRQMEEDKKKLIEQSMYIDRLLETRKQMEDAEKKRIGELSGMRRQKEEDEKKLIEQSMRIDRLLETRRQMEEDSENLKVSLSAIQSSRSWKMTAPLRALKKFIMLSFPEKVIEYIRNRSLQYNSQLSKRLHDFRFRAQLRAIYHSFPLPNRYKIKLTRYLFLTVAFFVSFSPRKKAKYIEIENHQYSLELPIFKPLKKVNSLPDIIIFSVIDWAFRMQRPQHIAKTLAERGHRVFYISNHFSNQVHAGLEAKQLSENLPLYWVELGLADTPAIYGGELSSNGLRQLIEGLTKCFLWAEIHQHVAIVQHSFWAELVFALPNCQVIYDCMDHHAGFNETSPLTIEKEKQLFKDAHLVVTSSKSLYEEACLFNSSVALIRNATDYDFFSVKPSVIYGQKLRRKKRRKIIGYYGAIAEWFDHALVAELAKAFPDDTILLVGDDSAGVQEKLKHQKNIIFTGEVVYEKLPYYLYAFDVCIIPFKVSSLTLATNPVKAYEYLSAGKPVVSIDLPELHEFSNLIKLADTHEAFIQQIKVALHENSSQQIAERKKFASKQTWASRVINLQKELLEIKEPSVSVIILTYNNLNLTQACLDSIDKYTNYKNIEIIVVDNASTDETADFLKKNYQHKENYKIILNTKNLGFSAGNNVGLKAATGDYLVLLNNDTRVTRGWVRTMVNHFRNNSKLGLLGPVTNNIGNEAKIITHYKNPDEMYPEVNEIVLKNVGKLLPLRTVAFFCVMISREVFEKVGLLDEAFGLGFFEDDDYCRRVQQLEYEIFCAEDVFIHHHLSASFDKVKSNVRQTLFENNKKIYESKWGPWQPHQYR